MIVFLGFAMGVECLNGRIPDRRDGFDDFLACASNTTICMIGVFMKGVRDVEVELQRRTKDIWIVLVTQFVKRTSTAYLPMKSTSKISVGKRRQYAMSWIIFIGPHISESAICILSMNDLFPAYLCCIIINLYNGHVKKSRHGDIRTHLRKSKDIFRTLGVHWRPYAYVDIPVIVWSPEQICC